MNEQFDKTLRDHIRDTFDHFDDQLANDGWKKYNKQKNRRRRAIIFWYSLPTGIAAALALLWMVNIFDFNQPNENKIAAKTEINSPNSSVIKENPVKDLKSQNSFSDESEKLNNEERIAAKSNQQVKSEIKSNQKLRIDGSPKKSNRLSEENLALAIKELNQKEEILNQQKEEEAKIQNFNRILAADNKAITVTKLEAENSSDETKTDKISVTEKGVAIVNAILNEPKASLFNVFNKSSEPILSGKKKRLRFSIDATTYMNFSEDGLYDQVNLGLGLTSDYKLGKRFSVNSGLSFNRQTSSFDGSQRTASDFQQTSFSNVATIPKAQITNAKLVGVDIPLNLKYSLKLGKTDAFLTTGFSSYALINERYINDFSVINYGVSGIKTSNVRTVQDNPEGAFAYFKFAQTLNFSFGVKYPLTQKSSISLEPFVKYPLSGIGYQNLKIGSGGISFKLNLGK